MITLSLELDYNSKVRVVKAWMNHPVMSLLDDPLVKMRFSEYWNGVDLTDSVIFEQLLKSEDDWFLEIFTKKDITP